MIKTLNRTLKQDRERFTLPKNVQDIIPVQSVYPDGIFQMGKNKFSKTFRFEDINYYVASSEDKKAMFKFGKAASMHIQLTASSPKTGLSRKYVPTATTHAMAEKKNCLSDSPKNTDSVYSLISRFILTSKSIFPFPDPYLYLPLRP